jgi:hypothetical protein
MSKSTSAAEAAAVWVPTEQLKPWAGNPRKNDPVVARVAESIKRFGFSAPIVARRADGEVIAGHTRLKAALALGLDRVPVRYMDLDPADAHLLAVADNKLGEIAEWDDEALLAALNEFRAQGADAAAVAGFGDAEIDRLSKQLGDAVIAFEDGDRTQTPEEKLEGYLNAAFRQIVLIYDQAEYDRVVALLDKVREAQGLASNTEVVSYLLARYADPQG